MSAQDTPAPKGDAISSGERRQHDSVRSALSMGEEYKNWGERQQNSSVSEAPTPTGEPTTCGKRLQHDGEMEPSARERKPTSAAERLQHHSAAEIPARTLTGDPTFWDERGRRDNGGEAPIPDKAQLIRSEWSQCHVGLEDPIWTREPFSWGKGCRREGEGEVLKKGRGHINGEERPQYRGAPEAPTSTEEPTFRSNRLRPSDEVDVPMPADEPTSGGKRLRRGSEGGGATTNAEPTNWGEAPQHHGVVRDAYPTGEHTIGRWGKRLRLDSEEADAMSTAQSPSWGKRLRRGDEGCPPKSEREPSIWGLRPQYPTLRGSIEQALFGVSNFSPGATQLCTLRGLYGFVPLFNTGTAIVGDAHRW